jgi:predicted GH43/DUF377 family glycosyl hydrolase
MTQRSIHTPPPVSVERLHGGHPVLEADPSHAWESRVVLNPAAAFIPCGPDLSRLMPAWPLDRHQKQQLEASGGACVLVYRAQGKMAAGEDVAPSSLGLAILTPDLRLVHRSADPSIPPNEDFHNLGVEDARLTFAEGVWHLYYTGYSGSPTPHATDRRVRICHATTTDFMRWSLNGPISGALNAVSNKNAALLPAPVNDEWILLHRPMEGPDAMAVHTATAPSPSGPWESRGLLFASYEYEEFERSWVGAGGPPIPVAGNRFLMIYHQGHFDENGRREYDLAAALLDFDRNDPVVKRIEPLMRPTGELEQSGDPEVGVDNVLFTCANYVFGDDVIIPYAGADSRIFGARVRLADLLAELNNDSG